MWYYFSDNKRVGPVADAAMMVLYSRGALSKDSPVLRRGTKKWQKFGDTKLFKKMNAKSADRIDALKSKTMLFRAFLVSFCALLVGTILIEYKRAGYFESVLDRGGAESAFLECVGREYWMTSMAFSAVLFVMFLFVARFAGGWIIEVVSNTRSLDKGCRLSPVFTAFSFLIPVVNLYSPFVALGSVYRTSKRISGRHFTAVDANLLFLWWFFSIFAAVMFILEKTMFGSFGNIEAAKGIIMFEALAGASVMAAGVFWIIVVSKICFYQAKAMRRANLL